MARRRIVLVEPMMLVVWMQGGALRPGETVTSDAPADLTIVGCGWDEVRGVVRLAVESSEFDDVPDGHFAPGWTPRFLSTQMSPYEAAMAVLRGA